MASVADGETGTVVWEPMTLDEYNDLRTSTSVTFTESATASDADSVLETVVAVVFAGGVAWHLAYTYYPVNMFYLRLLTLNSTKGRGGSRTLPASYTETRGLTRG